MYAKDCINDIYQAKFKMSKQNVHLVLKKAKNCK